MKQGGDSGAAGHVVFQYGARDSPIETIIEFREGHLGGRLGSTGCERGHANENPDGA